MKKLSIMITMFIIFGFVAVYSQEFMIEDSELWYQKAKQSYDKKDFANAKEALNIALDMWPENKKARKLFEKMDNSKVIDGKKGKTVSGWTVKKNEALPLVHEQKIIAVDNRIVLDDDVFHWMKKGDNFYARGDLENAYDAYRIANEMAPTNTVIKEKMAKLNVHRQNSHFNKLYPAKKIVQMETLTPRNEPPAAVRVVTSGGSLLSADPIYKEVITEVGTPRIPVDRIELVKSEDNVFPNLRLQELIIRVKKGMTFEKIFKRYLKNYQDMKKVAVYNKIRNMNKIKPGMLIRIPVKYLNLDYVDQYFSPNHRGPVHKKVEIVMPRDAGLPTPIQVKRRVVAKYNPTPIQVKRRAIAKYNPMQTDAALRKLKNKIKNKNDKQINDLRKEVSNLRKLLIARVVNKKKPEKTTTIKNSKLSDILSEVNVNEKKKVVVDSRRKKSIAKFSNKISEKERQKKLVDSRRKKSIAKLLNKMSEKERQKELVDSRIKKSIAKLSNKISEKERQEKLLDIREKLKQLKKKYYSKKKKPTEKEYKYQQEAKGLKEKIFQQTIELAKYKKETVDLKKKPVVEKVVMDSIINRFKKEIDKNQKELTNSKRIILKLNNELIQHNKTKLEKSKINSENKKLEAELGKANQQLTNRKRIILKLNEELIQHNKQTVVYNKTKFEKSKINRENRKLEAELGKVKQQLDYTKEKLKKKYNGKSDPNAPQVVLVSNSSAESHFRIAMEYWKKGLFSEAVDEYKKAVELDPAFLLRDDKGLSEAALNYARTTIKSRKSSMSRLHYKLAVIYQRKGFLNKALVEYKEILTETPHEEEVFFNMGLIFEQMKNYKSALESFEKISSLPKVSEKFVRMATTKIESIANKMKK